MPSARSASTAAKRCGRCAACRRRLPLPLFDHADASEAGAEPQVTLPVMPLSEHVVNDYRTLRLSLKAHPMSFLRARVNASAHRRLAPISKPSRDGARVSVAGVVLVRQRPGSAQAWCS